MSIKYNVIQIGAKFRLYVLNNFNGRNKAAADHYGVAATVISNIYAGRKPPTKAMLDDMGFIKVKPEQFWIKAPSK